MGNNLSIDAVNTAGITFVSGNKSGTAFSGGLQTIIAAGNPDVYFRTKPQGIGMQHQPGKLRLIVLHGLMLH